MATQNNETAQTKKVFTLSIANASTPLKFPYKGTEKDIAVQLAAAYIAKGLYAEIEESVVRVKESNPFYS